MIRRIDSIAIAFFAQMAPGIEGVPYEMIPQKTSDVPNARGDFVDNIAS